MKKILLLLVLCPILLATQCDPDDAPCGRLIEMQKNDLISIENHPAEYNLNDVLWLNASVDRNQQTSNSTFDLFEFNDKLAYYVELKKESVYNQNNFLLLNEQTTIVNQGESDGNTFILTKDGNSFKNRIGIKLLESGNYTLTIYNIGSHIPNRTDCNFTSFSILTDFNEMDSNTFSFVVN